MRNSRRMVMNKWFVRAGALALCAVALAAVGRSQPARAEEWVLASTFEDAEGKWTYESRSSDNNTSNYATDQSNRTGYGAVLKLNYATPVNSDRARVYTDFGFGVVDKIRLTVTYSDDSTATSEYDGAVVQNCAWSTLTFTKGDVKSLAYEFHYVATGYYFWLYELQLYQCPAEPDPLAGATLDPSSVNATSAVLHGQVTSNGGAPCCGRFKYWLDGQDALYTAWRSDLGNGQEFTAAVTGLTENGNYSYQAELAPSANPQPEEIVSCDPVKTFTAVKVTEATGPEWVSPGMASGDGWESPTAAMDDDEATAARWYHDIGADVWSPFIQLDTDLQANGLRLIADATNCSEVDVDICRDGEWVDVYEGLFTGGVWQNMPFEKGAVTAARIRLRCSASYLGVYLRLVELDFHQGEEMRTTRYFVGPGSDWAAAANWSTTSGGTGGASVPGTGCVAVFDANSPSCALSGNISVEVLRLDAGFAGSLDAAGYSIVIERNRGFGELRVAAGELKLGTGTHTIKDNFRYLGGTVTPGTSTVEFYGPNDGDLDVDGDLALNNVRIYHSHTGSSHKIVNVNGTLTVNGLLTLEGYATSWKFYLNGSGTLLANGDIAGNGTVIRGTANLTVAGAGDQTQTNLNWGTSGTYTVNKPSGTFYWAGTETFGDSSVSANADTKVVLSTPVNAVTHAPSVVFAGYGYGDVTLTGDLLVHNLKFYRPGGTGTTVFDLGGGTVTVENDLVIDCSATGGWKVYGRNGTVIAEGNVSTTNCAETFFDGITLRVAGAAAQTVDLGGLTLLSFYNENAAGVVTLPSGLTALDTLGCSAGSSAVFAAGATYATNKLAILGTAASPVTLRSGTDGTAWLLNVSSRYQSPECVNVKDSDASGGEAITAIESVDSGNNTNWSFYDRVDLGITSSAESATSPAWVQGECGPNIVELKVKVNGGTEFDAVRVSRMRWYADGNSAAPMGIPLTAGAATLVEVTGSDALSNTESTSQSITWTVTDLAGKTSADVVRIRKGDSLLLTATDSEGTGTTLEIDGDGDGTFEHSGATDDEFAHEYATAGTYLAKAKIDGVEVGTLTVVVIGVDLKGPIACQVGYQRTKSILVTPVSEAANLVYTGEFSATDPNYELTASVKELNAEGASLYLKALKRGTPVLYARLGENGPVVAKQEIDEFTLDVPAHDSTLVFGNTGVGVSVVTMRPYIPDLRQRFNMFGSQCTFAGGVTSFYAYTSTDYQQEYDEATDEVIGHFPYEIEVPEGEDSYCFTLNTEQAGSPWVQVSTEGTVNGEVALIALRLREQGFVEGQIPSDPVDPQPILFGLKFVDEGKKSHLLGEDVYASIWLEDRSGIQVSPSGGSKGQLRFKKGTNQHDDYPEKDPDNPLVYIDTPVVEVPSDLPAGYYDAKFTIDDTRIFTVEKAVTVWKLEVVDANDYLVPGANGNFVHYRWFPDDQEPSSVKMEVLDKDGTVVRTLLNLPTACQSGLGYAECLWDARNDSGEALTEEGSPYTLKLTADFPTGLGVEGTAESYYHNVKSWRMSFKVPDAESFEGSGQSGVDAATLIPMGIDIQVTAPGGADIFQTYESEMVNDDGDAAPDGKHARITLKNLSSGYTLLYSAPTNMPPSEVWARFSYSFSAQLSASYDWGDDKAKNRWDMDPGQAGRQAKAMWRFVIDPGGAFKRLDGGQLVTGHEEVYE